jgi:putative transposase
MCSIKFTHVIASNRLPSKSGHPSARMMYVRYPLSLRSVEDLLAERGIDISHETVRFWWNPFGPMFAAEIRKRRVAHMRGYPQWR